MEQRPKERGDCCNENAVRPCPWVACRHHLLVEVDQAKDKPGKIRLNMLPQEGASGRRPGLSPTATVEEVEKWTDDAVEQLFKMEETCSLDVVEKHPDGASESVIASALGTSHQAVGQELHALKARLIENQALNEWKPAGLDNE